MSSDALIQGVSGAIGGVVATVATYPLMTVTTRQATRIKEEPVAVEGGGGKRQAPPARKSTAAELVEIVRISGLQGLFGGLGTALFGTTISQGIYFYLYSLLRGFAVERRAVAAGRCGGGDAPASQDITVGESLLVAALAGMGNVLLTNPIWLIATRMQAQSKVKATARRPASREGQAAAGGEGEGEGEGGAAAEEAVEGDPMVEDIELPPPSFLGVCRAVYAEYGVKGFWNGCGASLVMVINPTIQYALYEYLVKVRMAVRRQQLRRQHGKAAVLPAVRASALEVFVLSALAKAGATVVTYPLLTIKTRMYMARKGDKDMQYAGIADAAVQILRKEGVAGYFKGLNSKIVQSVLAAALLFVAKEKITDVTRALLAGAAAKRLSR